MVDRAPPLFLCNMRLSISGMGDAPAFVIKGDAHAFVMEEGMRDAPAFVIKGDVPLATRVSFAFIIGDTRISLLSKRRARIGY
jgi:hypothetical protein